MVDTIKFVKIVHYIIVLEICEPKHLILIYISSYYT